MFDTALDRGLDQGARVHRVVAIVGKRLRDRIWHDRGSGKMDDRVDATLGDDRGDERLIAGIPDDEGRSFGDRPIETGGEVVEDDHLFAGVDQLVHHVASDVAGTAGDEDGHGTRVPAAAISGRVCVAPNRSCSTSRQSTCAATRWIC